MGVTGPGRDRSTSPAEEASDGGHASHWDDPHRATGFSDAVFAIIITLLVLDLPPPEGGRPHAVGPPGPVAGLPGLGRLLPHRYWVNLTVLFGTGVLPFPTAMVARAMGTGNLADERTAVALYAVIGIFGTLSWLLFWQYLSRHPELLTHDEDAAFFASQRSRAVAGAVVYVGAGLLGSLVAPKLALAIFVLAPIFYALTSEGLSGWIGSRRGS